MERRRLESLDLLRGVALLFILLFHASIYNFANINKLDLSHPPIVVVMISFMALWGGIFIIVSMVVNTLMVLRRSKGGVRPGTFGYLILAGLLFFVCHYLLTVALGRWNLDFVNNQPSLPIVAGTLRNMRLTMPPLANWFEGSPLSTIAANLMVLSVVLFALLKSGSGLKETGIYLILGLAGVAIMLASSARVALYPLYTEAVASHSYLMATAYSVTLANPYPLLPYLGYGVFGVLIGMMAYHGRTKLLAMVVAPAGLLFLGYGVRGMMGLPKTISTPDFFWYYKTQAELGLFLLIVVLALLVVEPRAAQWRGTAIIKDVSRISLTIYMLETSVSEIVRKAALAIAPSWNQTIEGCLWFGAVNVVLWLLIVFAWRKSGFRYSLEYFWVALFARIGKHSTKMDDLPA